MLPNLLTQIHRRIIDISSSSAYDARSWLTSNKRFRFTSFFRGSTAFKCNFKWWWRAIPGNCFSTKSGNGCDLLLSSSCLCSWLWLLLLVWDVSYCSEYANEKGDSIMLSPLVYKNNNEIYFGFFFNTASISAALWRSGTCSHSSPHPRLTILPRCTASRSSSIFAQRTTLV